jgi:hypothetical protein
MSVFVHDIQGKPKSALTLAEVSLAQALEKVEDSTQEPSTETASYLEQIRANIGMWTD